MRDKKSQLSLVIIALVVALAAATALVWNRQLNNHLEPAKQSQTSQPALTQTTKTTSLSYDGVEGKNALELLKAKANVVTKQSSYGEYVDSINGLQGGTDNKYWAFYVNGQLSDVGADAYQTKNGDKIVWKFE
jgi:uncharacterized protein HemX